MFSQTGKHGRKCAKQVLPPCICRFSSGARQDAVAGPSTSEPLLSAASRPQWSSEGVALHSSNRLQSTTRSALIREHKTVHRYFTSSSIPGRSYLSKQEREDEAAAQAQNTFRGVKRPKYAKPNDGTVEVGDLVEMRRFVYCSSI